MRDRPRGPGRPPHEPTEETREIVVAMVARGDGHAEIAEAIGVSEPTLLKHYEEELDTPGPQAALALDGEETPRVPRPPEARGGRPEHVPTKRSRERVEILVAAGQSQWQIASVLGISVPTLVRHYSEELDNGRAKRDAEVLEALYQAAAIEKNVTAMKAWLARDRELQDPLHRQPSPEPARAQGETLGKKEQARLLARSAHEGTDWADLLPH